MQRLLSITESENDLGIMFKDMTTVKRAFEQSQEAKTVYRLKSYKRHGQSRNSENGVSSFVNQLNKSALSSHE